MTALTPTPSWRTLAAHHAQIKGRIVDLPRAMPVHVVKINAALLGPAIYDLERERGRVTIWGPLAPNPPRLDRPDFRQAAHVPLGAAEARGQKRLD